MPLTLYWYILKELLKLMALSCAVLVIVISVAASIKPLTEGLLGPVALIKFVLFTAPTMLAFALPFAGAFASTLVFLRMSADNEITACAASGISYASILTPVAGLGLALTMALFFMANFIIPGFYRSAAQTVESDLMTVVVTRLNDNQSFRMGEFVLYADSAEFVEPPYYEGATIQPAQHIVMQGVAVGQLNRDGRMVGEGTARTASILVYQGEQFSWFTMLLESARYFDPIRGELIDHERYEVPAVKLPGLLEDKPRFLSWPQLRELRNQPERFDRVKEAQEQLIDALAVEALRGRLLTGLADGGVAALRGPRPGEVYELSAPRFAPNAQGLRLDADAATPVRVSYRSASGAARRYDAQRGDIQVVEGVSPGRPELAVRLEEVKVYEARDATRFTEHTRLPPLPRLAWSTPLFDAALDQMPARALMAWVEKAPQPQDVVSAWEKLDYQIIHLARRVIAQLHERAASSVACMLLLLLGALLAMTLRGQMPLMVYFWAFCLAILSTIIMNTGQRSAGGMGEPLILGLSVLWSGNVILAIVCGVLYVRLARN